MQEKSKNTVGIQAMIQAQLAAYFQAHEKGLPASGLYERIIREVEKPLIELTLKTMGGNQIKAAALLGLNRNTLRRKIKDLAITIKRPSKKSAPQEAL